MSNRHKSFGRFFNYEHEVRYLLWQSEAERIFEGKSSKSFLPYGRGRSYGDCPLNDGGILVDTSFLNRIRSYDKENGQITCEAGVTIGQLLELVTLDGWFVPVAPGTKYVTIGGAVANDIHGKNHNSMGSFGNHVVSIKLLRSDGKTQLITADQPLFFATIGGIGLTGIILEVTFKLLRVSSWFSLEKLKFAKLEDFFRISDESERDWEYTVAWFDMTCTGKNLGRGLFMRANHATDTRLPLRLPKDPFSVSFDCPDFILNKHTVKMFNWIYFNKQFSDLTSEVVHYDSYLFPLDVVSNWNRICGKRGFHQYQFVIPNSAKEVLHDIFKVIAYSEQTSFLSAIKKFGDIKPLGMLSFPMPGYTVAIDFTDDGNKTSELFKRLDRIVISHGGRIYPAKDSKMCGQDFRLVYNRLGEFQEFIDPKFSSSFWRRVMRQSGQES